MVSESNEIAWKALQQWDRTNEPAGLIKGPAQSGKTHLSNLWAERHNATIIEGYSLRETFLPEVLFSKSSYAVVENIDLLCDRGEEGLFHLLNHLKQHADHRIILTGNFSNWEHFALKDLRSRLQSLPQADINAPDDKLLSALIFKYFYERQISISEATISYLLPRIERTFSHLQETLERIDHFAMINHRPITNHLIREVLTS